MLIMRPLSSLSIFTRRRRLVFPYPLPFMGGEKEALLFVYPAKMTPPPPPTTLPTTKRQKRECFSRPNWRHFFLPIFFPKVPPPRSLFPLRPTVPHWIWRQEGEGKKGLMAKEEEERPRKRGGGGGIRRPGEGESREGGGEEGVGSEGRGRRLNSVKAGAEERGRRKENCTRRRKRRREKCQSRAEGQPTLLFKKSAHRRIDILKVENKAG